MRIRVGLVAAIVVVAAVLAVLIRPPITEPGLAHELIRMEREANEPIEEGVRGFVTFESDDARLQEYNRRQEIRAARLKEVIDRYGWPTKKMVGREGVHAAVRQLGRMRDDPQYVSSVLPQVLKSADPTPELAYLVDEVAVQLGEPQTFGTQLSCRDGVTVELDVKDEDNVDARRREFGLPPLGFDREAREGFCTDSFEMAPDSQVIIKQR